MTTIASEGFVVVGAGFPRTGTLSLKTALEKLLNGKCYHMLPFVYEGTDAEADFWFEAVAASQRGQKTSPEKWREFLKDCRSGVDYPVSLHYKVAYSLFI